jgi:uncharacterized protein (DUF58 family)
MLKSKQAPELILERLDWTVIRRLDGLLQGDYRTLFRGFGLDLSGLREYQPGDDIRYIDWNTTARLSTPYIREFLEEREINAWFLLDLSPSMDFGTVQTLKRNLLIDIVTVLSRLLTRHGNRVGSIDYSGQGESVIPPARGRIQVLRIISALLKHPPLKRTPPTNLTALFQTASGVISRRSLIFIVSDFISQPGWEKLLNLLAQRHEVIAIRLYDPREVDLPDIGQVVLEDAETGDQLHLDTHNAKFRQRFKELAGKREQDLNEIFRQAGIDVLTLSTESDMVQELIKFASTRKLRKRTPSAFSLTTINKSKTVTALGVR